MKISNNIKTFRNLKRCTQGELAAEVGITINYLSLLENGKREPSIELLKKISKALDVPVAILVMQVSKNPKDPMERLLNELYKVAIQSN